MRTVIILYEHSGTFTQIYREMGYNVITFDKMIDGTDCRIDIEFDARLKVRGILAFPPCTHLANSGARFWAEKGAPALIDAMSHVDVVARLVLLYKPFFWMFENPAGRLSRYYGKPAFTFDPYEFGGYVGGGDAYTKKTCLWGKFNKPKPWPVEPSEGSKMHVMGQTSERGMMRSKTPKGFAIAFASVNQ